MAGFADLGQDFITIFGWEHEAEDNQLVWLAQHFGQEEVAAVLERYLVALPLKIVFDQPA